MKRSLTLAAILTAAILGSGAWLAERANGASAASAPGKASCCADKAGAHKHACGDKASCCGMDCCGGKAGSGCDHKGMNPEMAAKMAEMDKRMDELAAKMNSARGDDKVDAMAAVLNEMLARHKAMRGMMQGKHDAMCGGAPAAKESEEKKSEGLLGEEEHAH